MTITYADGQTIQAALVVRADDRLRVVLEGAEDVTEFTRIRSTWVSEDLEPVRITSGHPLRAAAEYQEEDFVCSKKLASHLIHLLLNPEEDEELSAFPPTRSLDSTAGEMVM